MEHFNYNGANEPSRAELCCDRARFVYRTNLKLELELGLFTDELSPIRLLNVKRVQINDFGLYKRAEPN